MARKTHFVGFRAADAERHKLEQLSEATGQGFSEVLRSLVRSAEIEPVQTYRAVSANTNRNASTYQGERIAVGA